MITPHPRNLDPPPPNAGTPEFHNEIHNKMKPYENLIALGHLFYKIKFIILVINPTFLNSS